MLRAMLWTVAFACASINPAAASSLSPNIPRSDPTRLVQEIRLERSDRELVARAVIGEAAGEGPLGMAAVAYVIRNRVSLMGEHIPQAKEFGRTIPDILKQFDAMNRRRGGSAYKMARRVSPKSPVFLEALSIIDDVFRASVEDPTGGALFYYNPRTAQTPRWAAHFAQFNDRQIGSHRFIGALTRAADRLPGFIDSRLLDAPLALGKAG